jgi:hypothetical protein
MQSTNGKDFAALYALYPTVKYQWFINWCWRAVVDSQVYRHAWVTCGALRNA